MKTPNLSRNIAALSVLLVAGCAKAPSQATDSSPGTATQIGASPASSSGPPGKDLVIPAGNVRLMGIDLSQFLDLYAACAQAQVDTSQLGTPLPPVSIHFETTNAVPRSEMLQLFDKVLYDQAGIVATHPDKTHVVLKPRS